MKLLNQRDRQINVNVQPTAVKSLSMPSLQNVLELQTADCNHYSIKHKYNLVIQTVFCKSNFSHKYGRQFSISIFGTKNSKFQTQVIQLNISSVT